VKWLLNTALLLEVLIGTSAFAALAARFC
jgi:hypothetical protein